MSKQHVDNAECWCEPFLYYKSDRTLREVWVHRQCKTINSEGLHMRLMDNPPPEILSRAVELADNPEEDESTGDETMTDQAQCAHINVMYTPLRSADGTKSAHWGCRDCGTAFIPAAMYERAMQCGYHLCTMVADNAAAAVADTELREVARERIRDYITKAFEEKTLA